MRRFAVLVIITMVASIGLGPAAFAQESPPPPPADPAVPADSGAGRRIVYSNGQQRIWLVEEDGIVAKTHLVSGRRNFPRPGNYSVFSRSAVTRSGSVSMRYMVRWYQSKRLAVGFHAIPVTRRGRPIQSESELGRFRSHGCVRQRVSDAAFVWDWAGIGTPVVVVP